MANTQFEFEFDQVMRSYHEYLQAAEKGITIYLLIIGTCLALPNTLRFDSPEKLLVFKEMCRLFAVIVSLGGLVTYLVASYGFWKLHRRAIELAAELKLAAPTTWVLPFIIWASCTVAGVLLFLISRYT
ncbi:MAG: hypothetical protein AABY87_09245 [bacterium]